MAKRTKTSKAWMHEHVTDPFVKAAKRDGYRSRAAFKLLEIDKRDGLFKPGATVVDLGAAPGGWSQVARDRLGQTGRVVAVDLLPMEPIAGVDFLQSIFQRPRSAKLSRVTRAQTDRYCNFRYGPQYQRYRSF
jgi:23S rRNA (uridine2552-2'-O)-methyltransferase